MTVIAWDGKTLAADKRCVNNGLHRTVTKIYRIGDSLIAYSGDAVQGNQMLQWFRDGADVAAYPASQRDKEDWVVFVVVDASGVRVYERTPYPILIEDEKYACKSGRDFAIAAMHCGKTAREAVEVACVFDVGCGNGIDALELP
jgi:hypothetical protein